MITNASLTQSIVGGGGKAIIYFSIMLNLPLGTLQCELKTAHLPTMIPLERFRPQSWYF